MNKGDLCNQNGIDAECMCLNENNQYFVNIKNNAK